MLSPRHRKLRDESGFTLIETMVAMVTGLIVVGALFGILEISLSQSKHISNVAQATQQGRIAMNRMLEEVHSACIFEGFTPVQKGSKPERLILVDGYSKESTIPVPAKAAEGSKPAEGVFRDEIELSGESLLDKNALSESEIASGEYKFKSPTSARIGEHIKGVEETVSGKKIVRVFEYFEYASTPTFETTAASSTLKAIPASEISSTEGLTKTQAAKVAAVGITFFAGPSEAIKTKKEEGDLVKFNSEATLAFSAPASEAKVTAAPCE